MCVGRSNESCYDVGFGDGGLWLWPGGRGGAGDAEMFIYNDQDGQGKK